MYIFFLASWGNMLNATGPAAPMQIKRGSLHKYTHTPPMGFSVVV